MPPPGACPPQVCLPSLLRAFLGRVSLFLHNFRDTSTQDVHVLRGLARRPASLSLRYFINFGGPRGALSTSYTDEKSGSTESLEILMILHRHPREGGDPYTVKAPSDIPLISAVAG